MLKSFIARLVLLNAVFALGLFIYKAFLFGEILQVSGIEAGGVLCRFWRAYAGDLGLLGWVNFPVIIGLAFVCIRGDAKSLAKWALWCRWYCAAVYAAVFVWLYADFRYFCYFDRHIDVYVLKYLADDFRLIAASAAAMFDMTEVGGSIALIVVAAGALGFLAGRGRASEAVRFSKRARQALPAALLAANAFLAAGSFIGPGGAGPLEAAASGNGVSSLAASATEAVFAGNPLGGRRLLSPETAALRSDFAWRGEKVGQERLLRRTRRNAAARELRPNVVLVLRESWGADLMKYSRPDFDLLGPLKAHLDRDYTFKNIFPGDLGTHGSMQAVLLNMHRDVWPGRPYALYNSPYTLESEFFMGGALPFREAGYETVALITDFLDYKNLEALGFDRVVFMTKELGLRSGNERGPYNDYNGVRDDALYERVLKELAKEPGKPKFIFALTSSNHIPFDAPPAWYRPLPLNVPGELRARMSNPKLSGCLLTTQFANVQMAAFLDKVKGTEAAKNTIVAVAGDHPVRDFLQKTPDDAQDAYGVPFYLYVPDRLKPRKADTAVYGGHVDVMPTLYNLALPERDYYSLGHDLFDAEATHVAILPATFLVIGEYGMVDFVKEKGAWINRGAKLHGSLKKYFDGLISYARYNIALSNFLWDNEVREVDSMYEDLTPYLPQDRAVAERLDRRREALTFRGCEIWAHRGYHRGGFDNTILSFRRGFERGAPGTELDVWYDKKLGRLVVSHDRPYIMPEGKLLFLDDVFAAFGSRGSYWLDMKNAEEDTDDWVAALSTLLDRYGLRDNVFAESGYERALEHFSAAGVQTIWTIQDFEKVPREKLRAIGEFARQVHFTAISFDVQYLMRDIADSLAALDFPAFLYTLNEGRRIGRMRNLPNVKVILSDEDFYRRT